MVRAMALTDETRPASDGLVHYISASFRHDEKPIARCSIGVKVLQFWWGTPPVPYPTCLLCAVAACR